MRGSSSSLRGDRKTTPSFLMVSTQVVVLTVVFQVVEANLEFTGRPCTAVRKEEVVFLTQRRQATSDFRENSMVKPNWDDDDRYDNNVDECHNASVQVRLLESNCGIFF